ncbi:unknown [Bacteroides sp. CAG:770]|nr:unknown [Bacteroides sp. CAG:770]
MLTDEAFCFDPLGRRQFKVHSANFFDINIIQNSHNVIYLSRPPFIPTSWHPTISVKA